MTVVVSERLAKRLNIEKPVLFKLAKAGKTDPIVTDGPNNVSGGASFPPATVIFDKFEPQASMRMRVIRNVVGTMPVTRNGKTEYEEEVDFVRFTVAGNCMVYPHEIHKLAYLRLSNHNGSNPYRDRQQPVLWYEERDQDEVRMERIKEADLALEAELLAHQMDLTDLKALAPEFDIRVANRKADDIRHDTRMFARANPRKFISTSPNEEAKMKLLVADARSLRYLLWEAKTRQFRLLDETDPVMQLEPGQKPEVEMVKYLLTAKQDAEAAKLLDLIRTAVQEDEEGIS